MDKTTLGDRMKQNYENRAKTYLTRRTPVIVRLDGKAFHTFTRGFERPFSDILSRAMVETTQALCEKIEGVQLGFTQSDEISLLMTDFNKFGTAAWYDYNVQKIASVTASIATAHFNAALHRLTGGDTADEKNALAYFDSRCFNIPEDEVHNYFVWRQKDWERNSVAMLAQAHFSHKELHKKNRKDMQTMLDDKGIVWGELEPRWKRGTTLRYDDIAKWMIHYPIFTESPFVIQECLTREER